VIGRKRLGAHPVTAAENGKPPGPVTLSPARGDVAVRSAADVAWAWRVPSRKCGATVWRVLPRARVTGRRYGRVLIP